MWQENLFNNLLVVFILIALGLIMYCKIRRKSLSEVITEIKEALRVEDDE